MSPSISFPPAFEGSAGVEVFIASPSLVVGAPAAGTVAGVGVGVISPPENSPHCSAVNDLFRLTSNHAAAKSLLGYAPSGIATAATTTPPGCMKLIGIEASETNSFALSPVFNPYLRGYRNDTPKVLSPYFTVTGALRTIFLRSGFFSLSPAAVTIGVLVLTGTGGMFCAIG